MFKSIFRKYIFVFFLIISVSFLVLTFVITTLIDRYSINQKTDMLGKVAYSYGKLASTEYQTGNYDFFADYVNKSKKTFSEMYKSLSINVSQMIVFLTNESGYVLYSCGYGTDALTNERASPEAPSLPRAVIAQTIGGSNHSWLSTLEDFFLEKHIIYEVPVLDDDGSVIGFVFVSSSDLTFDPILRDTIRAVIISSLWVMLASLVAIYIISERMISPLRAMSAAAKRFAAGKFDVRVPVIGNDEVAELAQAFNQMATSLGTLEEMRRTFIANVSHDLRTPMTTIGGFIDGILDGAIPPEKQNYYLGIIASEVRRLSRLVTTLLDVSKLEAGEREFHMAPFDICENARRILISFEQKIDGKSLDVSFDCDDDNMFVRGDEDAIHQVLYNLCDNAIKFSREGGRLEIAIRRVEEQTCFSVYNEGVGIPEDKLPYIFDRFYKTDASRGLDKTGVGLGLYICRTIIDAHGGKIKAESTEGEFCRFSFLLPSEKDPRFGGELTDS